MISVDQLTAPLSGEDPCGEDLSLGTSLIELDALVLGKPETQFSEAEEPNWREVQEQTLELLNRSRDLRVAVGLALALLKTQGLPGLQSGLAVIRGLIEKHWAGLHPKLDPEDNNDPLQRMNILGVLSAPLGSAGDPMRFIERIRDIPLTNSPQLGKIPFGKIIDGKRALDDPAQRVDPAQVDAALRDTPAEHRAGLYQAALDTLDHIKGIETALKGNVSPAQLPNFGDLKTALTEMRDILAPHVESAVAPSATTTTATDAPAADGGAARPAGPYTPGKISNRQDVLKALEQIRTYYQQNEPASPIPLMIRRLERMVPMTFIEIMNEIAPDGMNQVTTIIGQQPS